MKALTRRDVLSKSAVLLLLPGARAVAGCGSSGAAGSCNGLFETSTVTNNHTHTLCVPTTDIENLPPAGVTYTTSVSDGHSHTVALSESQFALIGQGGFVTVTTSSPNPHNFTIQGSS